MTDWLKRLAWGCGVVCVVGGMVSFSLTVPSPNAFSQQLGGSGSLTAEGQLQVHTTLLSTGIQQIVVVDPRAKSMAVYHIEPATAKLQLKSVRNLVWDLQMEHFNGQAPLPSELRQVQP